MADTLEWLLGVFASQSPGSQDDLLLVDSTPVPCAQSRQTVRRSGYLHHTRGELERSMRARDRSVLDVAAAALHRSNGHRSA